MCSGFQQKRLDRLLQLLWVLGHDQWVFSLFEKLLLSGFVKPDSENDPGYVEFGLYYGPLFCLLLNTSSVSDGLQMPNGLFVWGQTIDHYIDAVIEVKFRVQQITMIWPLVFLALKYNEINFQFSPFLPATVIHCLYTYSTPYDRMEYNAMKYHTNRNYFCEAPNETYFFWDSERC